MDIYFNEVGVGQGGLYGVLVLNNVVTQFEGYCSGRGQQQRVFQPVAGYTWLMDKNLIQHHFKTINCTVFYFHLLVQVFSWRPDN